LSVAEWRAASPHFEPDVVARVTPEASVAAKRTPQSTQPAAVQAALAEVESWLGNVRA
jgi:argininosuccinate lyase